MERVRSLGRSPRLPPDPPSSSASVSPLEQDFGMGKWDKNIELDYFDQQNYPTMAATENIHGAEPLKKRRSLSNGLSHGLEGVSNGFSEGLRRSRSLGKSALNIVENEVERVQRARSRSRSRSRSRGRDLLDRSAHRSTSNQQEVERGRNRRRKSTGNNSNRHLKRESNRDRSLERAEAAVVQARRARSKSRPKHRTAPQDPSGVGARPPAPPAMNRSRSSPNVSTSKEEGMDELPLLLNIRIPSPPAHPTNSTTNTSLSRPKYKSMRDTISSVLTDEQSTSYRAARQRHVTSKSSDGDNVSVAGTEVSALSMGTAGREFYGWEAKQSLKNRSATIATSELDRHLSEKKDTAGDNATRTKSLGKLNLKKVASFRDTNKLETVQEAPAPKSSVLHGENNNNSTVGSLLESIIPPPPVRPSARNRTQRNDPPASTCSSKPSSIALPQRPTEAPNANWTVSKSSPSRNAASNHKPRLTGTGAPATKPFLRDHSQKVLQQLHAAPSLTENLDIQKTRSLSPIQQGSARGDMGTDPNDEDTVRATSTPPKINREIRNLIELPQTPRLSDPVSLDNAKRDEKYRSESNSSSRSSPSMKHYPLGVDNSILDNGSPPRSSAKKVPDSPDRLSTSTAETTESTDIESPFGSPIRDNSKVSKERFLKFRLKKMKRLPSAIKLSIGKKDKEQKLDGANEEVGTPKPIPLDDRTKKTSLPSNNRSVNKISSVMDEDELDRLMKRHAMINEDSSLLNTDNMSKEDTFATSYGVINESSEERIADYIGRCDTVTSGGLTLTRNQGEDNNEQSFALEEVQTVFMDIFGCNPWNIDCCGPVDCGSNKKRTIKNAASMTSAGTSVLTEDPSLVTETETETSAVSSYADECYVPNVPQHRTRSQTQPKSILRNNSNKNEIGRQRSYKRATFQY